MKLPDGSNTRIAGAIIAAWSGGQRARAMQDPDVVVASIAMLDTSPSFHFSRHFRPRRVYFEHRYVAGRGCFGRVRHAEELQGLRAGDNERCQQDGPYPKRAFSWLPPLVPAGF